MSKATAVSDIERAEHLNYADSKGVKRVSVFNDGSQINSATEEKQDDIITAVEGLNSFSIPEYDYLINTYVTSGNGIGEIETTTYKTGGASGTIVAVLTMTYDGNNNLSTVTKS